MSQIISCILNLFKHDWSYSLPRDQMHAIFGFGPLSEQLVEKLRSLGYQFIVVDSDGVAMESLKGSGYATLTNDPVSINKEMLQGQNLDTIILLDTPNKTEAIHNARNNWPDALLLTNDLSKEEIDTLGLSKDNVIQRSELAVNETVRLMNENRFRMESLRLLTVIRGADPPTLGIFTHDNPDPDAIASAMALSQIATSIGIAAKIYYGGKIERADNRVFVRRLKLQLNRTPPSEILGILPVLGKVAMVDCGIPGANNILPRDFKPDIVIDHHYTQQFQAYGEFMALYSDLGACSTILTKYLQDRGQPVNPPLAAALFYGIWTDTKGFTRNVSSADLKAVAYLLPLADEDMLQTFVSPPFDEKTMDMTAQAIKNRKIRKNVMITYVDDMTDRDALSQVSDFLMLNRGVSTVVVFGLSEDTYFISARNRSKDLHIGEFLKDGFEHMGSAGGHASTAGAQIPKTAFRSKSALLEHLFDLFKV